MDIFKKVSESAKSIGESAKSISKNTIETTKMRMEISKLEKEMENNINALGNLVYLQYKGDPDLGDEIDRLLLSTKSLEADITALKQQLAPVCVKCNAELPPNAKFCSNCGAPVSKTPEPPEVDETPSEE
ncbi:MAG: zinc ribbon domain-containing protein [Pelotomaculum sp.]|jgi:rRNA maturation endonuclease Nob1